MSAVQKKNRVVSPTFRSFTFQELATPPPPQAKAKPIERISPPKEPKQRVSKATAGSQIFPTQPLPNKNLKENPFKPSDQPIDSFYQMQSNNKELDPIKSKCKQPDYHFENRNAYRDKDDQQVSISTKEKKFLDGTSNIFNNKAQQEIKFAENVEKYNGEKNYAYTSENWSSIHIGRVKANVNENAQFDKNYAKKRRMEDFKTQNIPSYTNDFDCENVIDISPRRQEIQTNQPNADIKRKNQNFSDMFGQEYGYKNGEKGTKSKVISAHMRWNEFDSIRNQKDFSKTIDEDYQDMQLSLPLNGNQPQRSRIKSQCEFKQDFVNVYQSYTNKQQCRQSIDQIKGQFRPPYEQGDKINGQLQHYGNDEQRIKNQKNEKVYEGIYAWKNNYKK